MRNYSKKKANLRSLDIEDCQSLSSLNIRGKLIPSPTVGARTERSLDTGLGCTLRDRATSQAVLKVQGVGFGAVLDALR